MSSIIDKLIEYLQYPLVRRALVVGVLVALCASILGVSLVLKQFSYIGDGLSHVAFGAMAVATVCNFADDTYFTLPVTVICAVFLLKTGQNKKINGDALIAMLSVGALAIGYLLMNVFATSANISGDVCSTLFGSMSILTLTKREVNICVAVSIIVIIVFIVLYNKIFAVTFDESFAVSTGLNVKFYNTLIAITIAVIIVLSMKLVGSLLISALVIFPAVSSMRVMKSYKGVTICAAIFSVVTALLGILGSVLIGTPVGSTIVGIEIIGFIIFSLVGLIVRK
ncbi:MAG: metal ABC transporter permease [Lachnospiraceae bacterium]|nr:metal ABC transporter permease [Lachnospiraceae bacterium]